MHRLPLPLRLYVTAVTVLGLLGLLIALVVEPPAMSAAELRVAALVASLAGLAYAVPVKLASKRQVLPHAALHTIALLVFPPGVAAALLAAPALLANRFYLRRPWFNSGFNAAQIALTLIVAGLLYRTLAPVSLADPGRSLRSLLALIPTAAALYLVTALIVDGATAIQSRRSPFAKWWTVRAPTVLPHLMLVTVGAAVAPEAVQDPWLVALAVVPVVIIRSMLRIALGFDASVHAVAEAVATALHGHGAAPAGRPHAVGLGALVERAALEWGMTEDDARRAALVAHLSSLAGAVPSRLAAGGAGQPTGAAARFIERVLHLPAVAESVRCLNERFDGHGVLGLNGQALPIDARVVAVCRAWLELTAPQAYRPALSPVEAMRVLTAGTGRQWDPAVVRALARALEPEAQEADWTHAASLPAHRPAAMVA